jgi:hypothetical protein
VSRGLLALAALFLGACHEAAPPDPRANLRTEKGTYLVSWRPVPDPIPLSTLFVVETTVRDAETGAPVEDATVTVDARMPAHGHGMQTRPETDPGACDGGAPPTCRHPGGVYTTRGMNFHMPGEWALLVDVTRGGVTDHLEVTTTL